MSQTGPWLCINGTRRVNATNTLYVVRFISRIRSDWYKWALALLSSTAWSQIRRSARRYPDGLVKYEPGALARIELPIPQGNSDFKNLYKHAVAAILARNLRLARDIADSVLT